jgi:hypothetical protein
MLEILNNLTVFELKITKIDKALLSNALIKRQQKEEYKSDFRL